MIKKLISICASVALMSCLSLSFVNPVMAELQIGAFIADWSKDATYPWHGEQGILNYEEIIQRKVGCVKIYQRMVYTRLPCYYNQSQSDMILADHQTLLLKI